MKGIYHATVESCQEENAGSGIYLLELDLGAESKFEASPGQFVVLEPANKLSVMPRPFSIVHVRDNEILILIKALGENTRKYSQLKEGDQIKVYGPQGTAIAASSNSKSYILVGGGIGGAALIFYAKHLYVAGIPFSVYLGARSQEQIAGLRFFKCLSNQVFTIDDSVGFVTDLLLDKVKGDVGMSTVVACGPKPMLEKVAEICEEYRNECIVILEELMACGMGSCKGCAIWGVDKTHKHVCSDGPAFDAGWIDWERFMPKSRIQISSPVTTKEEIEMAIDLAGIKLAYPTMNCSGCLAVEALENKQFDYSMLGALVTKGVTVSERVGNPMPRTCEVEAGMINAIGLENKGIKKFVSFELLRWLMLGKPVIVNISGESVSEFEFLTYYLIGSGIAAIEVNISCPNIKKGGMSFGCEPFSAAEVTNAVCRLSDVPVIVKLTPNVTNIVAIAKAVTDAGANAISLINTVLVMSIDPWTRSPRIANIVGGLSGPAVKPLALRMVFQLHKANLGIPIIGMGGISKAPDAAEFIIAGANAIAVGTSGFGNREIASDIVDGLREIVMHHGYSSVREMVGSVVL